MLARCERNVYDLLTSSVPGICQILGMSILLETGPIECFAKVGHYSSCALQAARLMLESADRFYTADSW